jgi:type VI protein secretion system component VasF
VTGRGFRRPRRNHRPPLGSPAWRAKFDADRERFDRWWPWWVALCVAGAVALLVLVATGNLPLWVLFV